MLLKHLLFYAAHRLFAALHQLLAPLHRIFAAIRRLFAAIHQAFLAMNRLFAAMNRAFAVMHRSFATPQAPFDLPPRPLPLPHPPMGTTPWEHDSSWKTQGQSYLHILAHRCVFPPSHPRPVTPRQGHVAALFTGSTAPAAERRRSLIPPSSTSTIRSNTSSVR